MRRTRAPRRAVRRTNRPLASGAPDEATRAPRRTASGARGRARGRGARPDRERRKEIDPEGPGRPAAHRSRRFGDPPGGQIGRADEAQGPRLANGRDELRGIPAPASGAWITGCRMPSLPVRMVARDMTNLLARQSRPLGPFRKVNYYDMNVLDMGNIDLTALEIFKTVVEQGGIAKAAIRLHRVPSNVTTRVGSSRRGSARSYSFAGIGGSCSRWRASVCLATLTGSCGCRLRPRLRSRGGSPAGVFQIGALESTAATRLPPVLSRLSPELSRGAARAGHRHDGRPDRPGHRATRSRRPSSRSRSPRTTSRATPSSARSWS